MKEEFHKEKNKYFDIMTHSGAGGEGATRRK